LSDVPMFRDREKRILISRLTAFSPAAFRVYEASVEYSSPRYQSFPQQRVESLVARPGCSAISAF
jgi:hypothetical protein